MIFVRRLVSGMLFGALLLGRAALAQAETNRATLLISGAASPHDRELVTTTIAGVAGDVGSSIESQTFAPKEASAIAQCVLRPKAWSCLPSVVRSKGLQHVVVVSLASDTGSDGSPMVVITEQVIVASFDAAIGSRRFCVRCTDDVLTKLTGELTRSLLQQIAARSGRTVVAINSTPRGARITFDGASMGATDRSFNTYPGTHTVVLELEGYQRELRSIDTALDKTFELSVPMRPVGGPAVDLSALANAHGADPPYGDRLAPALAIAGMLTVAAGVAVLGFDQDPVTVPIGTKQPAHYYDTTGPGFGLIVGGAVLSAGGFLWWYYTGSTTTPIAAPISGGAMFGLEKVF